MWKFARLASAEQLAGSFSALSEPIEAEVGHGLRQPAYVDFSALSEPIEVESATRAAAWRYKRFQCSQRADEVELICISLRSPVSVSVLSASRSKWKLARQMHRGHRARFSALSEPMKWNLYGRARG